MRAKRGTPARMKRAKALRANKAGKRGTLGEHIPWPLFRKAHLQRKKRAGLLKGMRKALTSDNRLKALKPSFQRDYLTRARWSFKKAAK